MVVVGGGGRNELVLVEGDGGFGQVVGRRGGAPTAAPTAAAATVPTRGMVHNHYGAVNLTAGTAGLATGFAATTGATPTTSSTTTIATSSTAGADASAVVMLLLLLRVVVVVGLAVFVLGEHRCRCRGGCRPVAITFTLAAHCAAGRQGASGRCVWAGGGGRFAVLAAAPVGTAAALPAADDANNTIIETLLPPPQAHKENTDMKISQ